MPCQRGGVADCSGRLVRAEGILRQTMNRLWSSQEGITLIGVLAFVSILSLVWTFALSSISTGGTALVQRPAPRVIVVDDGGLAFKYLNEAADLFVKDARSAVRTDLVDGAPPASSVTLSWTEEFLEVAIPRTASYRLDGDVLVRTFDGHSRMDTPASSPGSWCLQHSHSRATRSRPLWWWSQRPTLPRLLR